MAEVKPMELDRRAFLKTCGLATGLVMLPCGVSLIAPSEAQATAGQKGMLSDLTRCIGCGWCQDACREWNHLAGPPLDENDGQQQPCLSAETWTLPELHMVESNGQQHKVFVKRQCMHCVHPACVSACPVGALQKTDSGAVTYDCTRCIGCRYCMVACPFGVPKFEWDQALPKIQKCTLCADRQEIGLAPACAAACPTGALLFGDRDELIAEAEARLKAEPERYYQHIYGKDEIGGTSWLYLSSVPFAKLGFPALEAEPVTELSEAVATYGTVGVGAGVTLLLGGLYYWFKERKDSVQFEPRAGLGEGESEQ
jgi:formate dehydrogenase iron-sulfur subunit